MAEVLRDISNPVVIGIYFNLVVLAAVNVFAISLVKGWLL